LLFRKIIATILSKATKEENFDMGDKTPNKPPKKKKKVEKTTATQPVIITEKISVKKPKK
jgi:membrane-anchored glycerophosphoryl diester phosphodiesterase (GDPDase)